MSIAANKRSVMTLFSSKTDMTSHQVRIMLAEKGVSVDIEYVDADNMPQDLIDVNPYCSLPTLVDRELTLYQSRIIMEYLDERFPHPPLMPVYPVSRGESRLIMYRIENDWYSLAYKIMASVDGGANSLRIQLHDELLAISPIFNQKPYFMSDEFSLVDCYLAPLLWRLGILGIELTGNTSNSLRKYMACIFERNTFLASLTNEERKMQLHVKRYI